MMTAALLEFPFWRPLCAAVLLGLFLPVFGRHLVLGRCALLGLAIPQLTMTGIVAAFTAAAVCWCNSMGAAMVTGTFLIEPASGC